MHENMISRTRCGRKVVMNFRLLKEIGVHRQVFKVNATIFLRLSNTLSGKPCVYNNLQQLEFTVPQQEPPHPDAWHGKNPTQPVQCPCAGVTGHPCSMTCRYRHHRPYASRYVSWEASWVSRGRQNRAQACRPFDEHAYTGESHKIEYHMGGRLI